MRLRHYVCLALLLLSLSLPAAAAPRDDDAPGARHVPLIVRLLQFLHVKSLDDSNLLSPPRP